MTQNIAHFFNLGQSLFQVVRGKRLAPMLLVEGPVLIVRIGLHRNCPQNEMHALELFVRTGQHRCETYFHFWSEWRNMSIFCTTHNHLLKRVPFIVAAHGTLLLHRLSNMVTLECALRLCSSCRRCALEGPLRPPSHRTAELRKDKDIQYIAICLYIYRNIQCVIVKSSFVFSNIMLYAMYIVN